MQPDVVERLAAGYARIAARGPMLADRFLTLLFARDPKARVLFPEYVLVDKRLLVISLRYLMKHLQSPEQLRASLLELGRQHAEMGAGPEHYPVVRDTLLEVMAEAAGDEWTDAISADWKAALDCTAAVLVEGQREADAALPPASH